MYFTAERNVQMLIFLMKEHGIKHVVISPGATNVTFVASIQQDKFFNLYSSVDERSAAYIACGIASQLNEPVALSCTGATASRNYLPGLTEAFYRKLPILAITSTQNEGLIGQGTPQVIDRSVHPNDTVTLSVSIPTIQSMEDERYAAIKLNNALLELKRYGGSPVHINLATNYSKDYSAKQIPPTRIIRRYFPFGSVPNIKSKRIAICIGSHIKIPKDEEKEIETFCESYDAVVLCDHNSGYYGKYRIQANLILDQDCYSPDIKKIDLMIDIGNISGAYFKISPRETWRVSEDGEIMDTYRTLTNVFQMPERIFFSLYNKKRTEVKKGTSYYDQWRQEYESLYLIIPQLPFSNLYAAYMMSKRLPGNSILYLGILNSLRSWNFFTIDKSINSFSNTGGFGIEGGVSSLVGASLVNKERLCFAVVGDLSFFYDMNVVGNRHIKPNVRIMVINNGIGMEFKNYIHNAYIHGEKTDAFIAAAGHFGNKSKVLLKHYAEDLGFDYISASDKNEFDNIFPTFISLEMNKPIIFEVFTDPNNENEALHIMRNLKVDSIQSLSKATQNIKNAARKKLGDKRVKAIKDLITGR